MRLKIGPRLAEQTRRGGKAYHCIAAVRHRAERTITYDGDTFMAQAAGAQERNPSNEKKGGKFLAFTLSKERYGIDILRIQEIIGVMNITKVPRAPEYLRGVINLRGKIIPVVDLRLKFGLPAAEYDERTCIIVVNATFGSRSLAIGVIVDTVLEVTTFAEGDIEPTPDYGAHLNTKYLKGLGRCPDKSVIILLDIEKALGDAGEAARLASTEISDPSHE